MIDIHSHILWGVDDGASTLEESVQMLRIAGETGTTDIVATPHANAEFPYDPMLLASRHQELALCHTGPPRVHQGCDFHLSAGNVQDALKYPTKYTVNGGRYLMVELPNTFHPPAIGEVLRQLSSRGMQPIITHPERNEILQRSPDTLRGWVDRGYFAQITALSLTGGFGKHARHAAWAFLRSGHVQFVASDCHDSKHRPPRLDQARTVLQNELGEVFAAQLITENPRAVIEDSPIEMDIGPAPSSRKWFHFWRR